MWICLCKHINHKEVEEAIRKGAKDPDAIFAYHNKFPKCQTCFKKMEEMVKESELLDVVSIESDATSGKCIYVLAKDEKGNVKTPGVLLEEAGLFLTEEDGELTLTIKKYKMSKEEYEALPEFPGW